MFRFLAVLAGFAMYAGFAVPQAHADLKLCNKTNSRVGIAIGYKNKEGWASEGWWTSKPLDEAKPEASCMVLLKGPLIGRYYYVYAVDYDKGGSWGGKSQLCIRDKIFTIKGFESCTDRGFLKAGFFEVDTGEQADWTVTLSGNKTTPQ